MPAINTVLRQLFYLSGLSGTKVTGRAKSVKWFDKPANQGMLRGQAAENPRHFYMEPHMLKNNPFLKQMAFLLTCLPFMASVQASQLAAGQPAPPFQLQAQDGSVVSLAARQGMGWTVLYFYPKAGTPGCTTQACAFRDAILTIRKQNAEVYGISTDEVKSLLDFHQKHKLSFTLLADPDAKVADAYGVKMPVLKMAKRWTFIIDPALVIRKIDDDVDPALDAQRVVEELKQLQSGGD